MHILEAISLKVYVKEDANAEQWFRPYLHFTGASVNRRTVGFSLRSKSVLAALLPAGRQTQEGPIFFLLHGILLEWLFS